MKLNVYRLDWLIISCLIVAFTGLFPVQVKAQVSNYSFSATTGTFTEITVTGGATQPALTGGSNDDGYFNSIPIGFNLAYDGNIYNSLSASTNGFVVLGTDLTYGNTWNDLTSTTPRPILTPLWDDLDLSSGSFRYQTEGTAPNRIFTAQWLSMEWYYSNNVPVISFQLKLYETTNTIDFIYRQEANPPSSGCSASIGISGVGTGTGNFLSLNNTSAAPTASSIIETTSISTRPATGQVYSFGPPIATQPPNCVNIAYPADGDTNVLIHPEFQWASGGGVPEGYLLFIGDDGGGVNTPTNIVNGDTVVPPYTLSLPLNYLITYYWQVIPYNSFGQATGCPIYSFTTQPDPTISTFPFFESFENAVPPFTWLETIVNPGSGTLPDWTMESTGWSPNCMPHDGIQMAKFNSYSCSSGSSRLSTPPLNMTALTAPGLSFWMYHDDGYNTYYNEGIQVQVSTDGLTWNNVDSLIPRLSPINHWEQHIFDLSAYAGQTIYLGFLGVSEYGNNCYMDEVSVNEASGPPPCANMGYPANGDTGVSATPSLIFNQGGLPSAAGFRLYFGTDGGGIIPPTDIENGTILTSPYLPANPLTYLQTYYWQVVPFNSYGDASGCPIYSFTVRTDPTRPLPFLETFDATYNIPMDWSTDFSIDSYHGNNGTNGLYKGMYSWANTGYFITPPIGPVTTNSIMEFDYRILDMYTYPNVATILSPQDKIYLMVSSNNGLSYDTIYTIDQTNHVPSVPFGLMSNSLTAYDGMVVVVKLMVYSGNTSYYLDIDNFTIYDNSVAPGCTIPVSPASGDTNVAVTASLVWQHASGAAGYTLFFGTDGGGITPPTNIENGTIVNSPYVLTAPMSYSTTYYWQVVPFNNFGSPVNCPIWSFTTRQDPTRPIPWMETFDSTYALPADWQSDMYISSSHGLNNSNALSGEMHSWQTMAYAMTPPVGPVTSNSMLEFQYRIMDYNSYPNTPASIGPNDKVYVMVSNNYGLTYDTLYIINDSNHIPSIQYEAVSVSLAAYDMNAVMVRLSAVWGQSDYYLDFDEFTIFDNTVPPICANLLSPLNGYANTAIYAPLVWSHASGATGYTLFFGTDGGGVTPPTNLANGVLAVSPYLPSPMLTYSTTYYWQVVPFNSFGSPANCPIYTFTTMADPTITAFPYAQGFEVSVPPLGWTEEVVVPGSYTTAHWSQETMSIHPSGVPPHEGTYMARFNSYSCYTGATDRLRTPPVDFTTLSAPSISFWMYHDNGYSSYLTEGVHIQYSTDGTTWNDIGPNCPRYSPNNHWEQHIIDLSTLAGQTAWLGITGYSEYGNDCYIDEVMIYDQVYTAMAGPDVSICTGGSTQLNVTVLAGTAPFTFLWAPPAGLNDPTLQNPTATPSATTTYTVSVTDNNGAVATDDVVVTVNPLPTVTLAPYSTVCINWPPFQLTGGNPAGGTYSGAGVTGNFFNPGVAGAGTHTITYTYTDANGCSNSATQPLEVSPCLGLPEVSEAFGVQLFPNPSAGLFDLKITGHEGNAGLSILNLRGQAVWEKMNVDLQKNGYTDHLDLSACPKGIYYLKITGEKVVKTLKIIIQ